MIPLRDRPHVVYEMWRGETCLYVGMTVNLPRRLATHRSRNALHLATTELRTTECGNRAEAEAVEGRLIRELRPVNNVRGVA